MQERKGKKGREKDGGWARTGQERREDGETVNCLGAWGLQGGTMERECSCAADRTKTELKLHGQGYHGQGIPVVAPS